MAEFDDQFDDHHIKIMKVALAIAIIRQKPESVSASEYTIRLSKHVQEADLDWRVYAKQLESQLLTARQDLVRCRLQAVDLTNERSAKPGEMGGDNIGTNDAGRGGVVEERDKGGGLQLSAKMTSQDIRRVQSHVNFCTSAQRIIKLHSKLPAVLNSDLQHTFKDSILHSIRGINDSISQSSIHSWSTLSASISCITGFLSEPVLVLWRAELSKEVIALANTLLCIEPTLSATIEQLQSAIVELCRVQVVLLHVVSTLAHQLCDSASQFSRTLEGETLLTPELVDTAERQVAVLEAVLSSYSAPASAREIWLKRAEELEDSLLELSEPFPLFTYAVWKVIALLKTPTHQMKQQQ